MNEKKKVLIIGAGPAGLTAAFELLKSEKDYDVTILEESSDIGGISRTVKHNGNRMDIGGHRFFSKDDRVMEWWRSLMPLQGAQALDDKLLGREKPIEAGGPDPKNEDRVILIRERVSRIYYLKKFFDYPVSMKLQTIKNMGLLRTAKAGFSYMKSAVIKKNEDSLENFYINRFGKVLYGMFFEKYTQKLWGRHPSEISADWGAQRVKGLSILAVLKDMFSKAFGSKDSKNVETSLIEQFWYPKLGPGQLWETAAQEVQSMGGSIRFNTPVRKIHLDGGRVKSVTTESGEEIFADEFISTMPLKDLVEGMDASAVPENAAYIAKNLPYRDFITVGLLVNKLNLKNETGKKTLGNIVPDCWIYVQEPDVKLGRIQIFNNWSPYMLQKPENQVWIGLEYFCDEGDEHWNMSEKEFTDFAAAELAGMDVINSASDVLDSHRERVKKAYPAYFDTYSRIDELTSWLDGIGNLFCIGRNGQHRYNNMDHSMATAFEAVKNINSGSTDKENIWNVNTEKEYHEEKSN
ncbi:MAG: NAD(P)/FAD-dependent oxidoreductase [Oscillospiraceae bacterium]|jgi:protoporphyrinogen oxidase|nr:NAD(P)/FAD-dependent oxidoreductase [Oscillospiraceae bacterium]